jgi:CHC2 zinc finger
MIAPLERVLGRLHGVRRSGAGWIALCPAHPDRNPSLSVHEKNDRILLHCFAGCSVQAICATLGLELSDLYAAPRPASKPEPDVVRRSRYQFAFLDSRLTPRDRQRDGTLVLANKDNPDPAMARALALAVEGELVQIAFKEEE